jgi:NADH:ubiquinone oxidoreductase subunit 4 (subunit M)
MLWYGYVYYIAFVALLFITLIFALRLFYVQSIYLNTTLRFIVKQTLSFFLFFTLTAIFVLYNIFDHFSGFQIVNLTNLPATTLFTTSSVAGLLNYDALGINMLEVYYFPFIYIFMLITLLSILYCLSYNVNELSSFMFYCSTILLSGYVIFFTDSIILFFFAYEMLLVPSFFILYNFAKTRRCVEAAYLMFFWTQFGALFLIFSFLYLFFFSWYLIFFCGFNFPLLNFRVEFPFFLLISRIWG